MLVWIFALSALAGELLVDVLDVGQGDSVLIRGGGKAVLIDAGPSDADVVGQLRTLGITRLDLVVATHPHADHIGRMKDVVTSIDVGLYVDNGLPHTTRMYDALMTTIEERHVPYRAARQGMKLNLGAEATLTVLFPANAPLTGTRSDLNSNSVVLWLDHGEVDMLFTGDSEAPTERALLGLGLASVEVLKVAHHGSEHSSTQPFLAALQPRFALISCGTDNRYGHPDPEALARYAHVGAAIYRTDLSGNLRVVSDGMDVEILEGSLAELERVRIVPRAPVTPLQWAADRGAAAPDGPSVPEKTRTSRDTKRATKRKSREEAQ